jgi:hypothetical protein
MSGLFLTGLLLMFLMEPLFGKGDIGCDWLVSREKTLSSRLRRIACGEEGGVSILSLQTEL